MEKNMENELEIGTREGVVGCLRYSGVLLVEETTRNLDPKYVASQNLRDLRFTDNITSLTSMVSQTNVFLESDRVRRPKSLVLSPKS